MKFLPIIALIIFAEILFFAYLNYSTIINFKILPTSGVDITLAYVLLFVLAQGIVAGIALLHGSASESQNKLKEYKRKLEKTSVNADCDSSKVAVLESKIAVLEKALQSALDKNS